MRTKSNTSGFSLLELIIASMLLGVMLYAVAALSLSGADASDLSRRLTRSAEVTQEIINDLRLELVSSVRLFGNDAEGNANIGAFDLSTAPVAINPTLLPTIDPSGSFRTDTTGNQITGNGLFFARLAWSDRFICTSGNEYLVDVLRWVAVYLTAENGGPSPGTPLGLNLVRVVSEPLVDGASVDRITDPTDQAEVLLHLHDATPDATGQTHAPCQVVWTRGAMPAVLGAIRQIHPTTGALSDTVVGGTGRSSPLVIESRDSAVDGMLYYRHHSIASNYSQPSYGVGTFGIQSTTNDGFPHGFEVQITGPSSARQVLVHLVVTSTNGRGHRAWSDVQIVVDCRDT